jgi:hypothetical protein
MDTYGDLVNEVLNETRRASMSDVVSNLILDSIAYYAPERLWFNLTNDTTFSLSSSQATYTSADSSMIPRFREIDRFEVTVATNDKRALDKKSYNWIADYNETNANSQPYYYTYWGEALHVNLPDGGYEARLSGVVDLPSLSVSTDSNAWTQRGKGKDLIKHRTKSLLYSEYLRDDLNATRADAREKQELTALKLRTSRLLGTGEITPCL